MAGHGHPRTIPLLQKSFLKTTEAGGRLRRAEEPEGERTGKEWMILPWAGCQAEGMAAVSQMKVHSTPARSLVMSSPLREGLRSTAGLYLHFISMTELFIFSVKQRRQNSPTLPILHVCDLVSFFFFKARMSNQCQNVTKIKHRVTFCALSVSGNN